MGGLSTDTLYLPLALAGPRDKKPPPSPYEVQFASRVKLAGWLSAGGWQKYIHICVLCCYVYYAYVYVNMHVHVLTYIITCLGLSVCTYLYVGTQ